MLCSFANLREIAFSAHIQAWILVFVTSLCVQRVLFLFIHAKLYADGDTQSSRHSVSANRADVDITYDRNVFCVCPANKTKRATRRNAIQRDGNGKVSKIKRQKKNRIVSKLFFFWLECRVTRSKRVKNRIFSFMRFAAYVYVGAALFFIYMVIDGSIEANFTSFDYSSSYNCIVYVRVTLIPKIFTRNMKI